MAKKHYIFSDKGKGTYLLYKLSFLSSRCKYDASSFGEAKESACI